MSFFAPFDPLDAFMYDEFVECAVFASQYPRGCSPSFRPLVATLPWEWGTILGISAAYGKLACRRPKPTCGSPVYPTDTTGMQFRPGSPPGLAAPGGMVEPDPSKG